MADNEDIDVEDVADETMGEPEGVETVVDETAPAGLEDIEPTVPTRTTFLE